MNKLFTNLLHPIPQEWLIWWMLNAAKLELPSAVTKEKLLMVCSKLSDLDIDVALLVVFEWLGIVLKHKTTIPNAHLNALIAKAKVGKLELHHGERYLQSYVACVNSQIATEYSKLCVIPPRNKSEMSDLELRVMRMGEMSCKNSHLTIH